MLGLLQSFGKQGWPFLFSICLSVFTNPSVLCPNSSMNPSKHLHTFCLSTCVCVYVFVSIPLSQFVWVSVHPSVCVSKLIHISIIYVHLLSVCVHAFVSIPLSQSEWVSVHPSVCVSKLIHTSLLTSVCLLSVCVHISVFTPLSQSVWVSVHPSVFIP